MNDEIKITIEGPCCSGKSTLMRMIYDQISNMIYNVVIEDMDYNNSIPLFLDATNNKERMIDALITRNPKITLVSKQILRNKK